MVLGCNIGKKRLKTTSYSDKNMSFGDLYGQLFKAHGLLPDVVARQDPWLLFMMLDGLSKEEREIPPNMAFFYGE